MCNIPSVETVAGQFLVLPENPFNAEDVVLDVIVPQSYTISNYLFNLFGLYSFENNAVLLFFVKGSYFLTIFEFLTSFLCFLVPRIESWTPGQLLWTTPKKKKFSLRNYLFIKTYLSIQLSTTVVHYATTILLTL